MEQVLMSKGVGLSCATLPSSKDSFMKRTHFKIFFHDHTDQGKTPLHIAAHNNHFDVCCLLLEKGASVNAQTDSGHTPLHMALMGSGNQRLVTKLIEKGLFLNFTQNNTQRKFTTDKLLNIITTKHSFHSRSNSQSTDILSLGANVLIKDSMNKTFLHYAATYDKHECMHVLAEAVSTFQQRTLIEIIG
jgi:ankyrin repeat protein